MSLADYLEKNYGKKKSKSKQTKSRGPDIVEDETDAWADAVSEEPDHRPKKVARAQSANKSGWKKLGTSEVSLDQPKPFVGGLQTAEQLAEEAAHEEERIRREMESLEAEGQAETIYRDTSGRQVDAQRELEDEMRQKELEQQEKLRLRRQVNQGIVQQREAEQEKSLLEGMKAESAHAGEGAYDEELRHKARHDDPAAQFLKKRKSRRLPEIPVYKGNYPANRFNIPPGFRWDGVDRSNGFESKWLRRQNERKDRAALSYSMQYDL
ncbi:pre-mRNA-splicing factor CWC26 [Trichomonascus vanleenenianus]|uniref:Bud13p n=1 Tax=Trichomonascus vanleenenianus TaxID=2268995 RepID=UPI003ECABCA6